MSDKLRECPLCGEPVVYHAPEASDELGWILCPKCFCEMSEFHFTSHEEMFAAWNRRASGWRPDWEKLYPKLRQLLDGFATDASSWSQWDEEVRNELIAFGAATLAPVTPPEETNDWHPHTRHQR